MDNIFRLTGAVNKVTTANPLDCLEETIQLLDEIPPKQSDITIFPKLSLSSPSCGNLFTNRSLLDDCEKAIEGLKKASFERSGYLIAGIVVEDYGKSVSAMAILNGGELIGLIPTLDNASPLANSGFSDIFLPADTVFGCGKMRFCILGCNLSTLLIRASAMANLGCDLILIPAYSPVRAGFIDEVCSTAKAISKSLGCAVAIVNGGIGDTSSPYLYNGFVAVFEAGEELCAATAQYQSFFISVDIDLDIISSSKKVAGFIPPVFTTQAVVDNQELLRKVSPSPFLPSQNKDRYLAELFELQVRSLIARMENTSLTKLVVGVSGGLDSTAVLLCCARAMDILELPRDNIIGITMPGFGTSDRTYFNALSLLENLGVTRRDISIKQSVQLHFEDIGHTGKQDVTYENAQARERAQILLDIANSLSGLVVGSGDLSEEALGFCTFAGDHISNYNVNVCITKTVLRELVKYIIKNSLVPGCGEFVLDILDTPISPELLPPSDAGEIEQKTEEILGPYELHDFFLYYFVRYRMRPSKIFEYAAIAFSPSLSPAFIKEKLTLFLKRFCQGQFKRACAPDSAVITEVNLSNISFYIPSDLDPSVLLKELDSIEL